MFRHNVGGIDRGLRVVLGTILTLAGLWMMAVGRPYGWLIALVGVINLLTGSAGVCPLYVPFGISTARRKSPGQAPGSASAPG